MPQYSSRQFYKDWRYSVEKDFTGPSGEPVKYAQNGFRTWGSEYHKIPLSKPPIKAEVNHNGSLIAIAVEEDIHIYETEYFAQVLVLKGHLSKVDNLAFQPGNSKALVSSAQNYRAGSPPAEPAIIIWDLNKEQAHPPMEDGVLLSIASQATETIANSLLNAQPRVDLSSAEQESLTLAIEPVISRIVKTHSVVNKRTIHGRLAGSFRSETFSPSGKHLIYLPGNRPRSNDTDIWDVKIYSMSTHEDVLTLTGHTDALMWSGYSPDEKLIGTVAWDQSMRIWDSSTGEQKYKFDTKGQNWTGGFSPDSERFAGTCGNGTFYVYSMSDGSELLQYKSEPSAVWMRTLSWSADSKVVAVGGGNGRDAPGRLFLYDVENKEVVQERILSVDACDVAPVYKSMMGSYLECQVVRFVDEGRKVVVLTSGDGGIETYDLKAGEKWRFARPGIDPVEDNVKNEGEEKKYEEQLEHGGYSMTVWEDKKRGKVWYASLDGDAVRIWDVPLTKENEA